MLREMKQILETVKNRLPEWVTAGAAFIYYWVMALYKLTQAPIWQDEAMEFYCSVSTKGEIVGVTKLATMYERVAYIQQQPPLYNWLMCLWLKVNEGEWWFRFSSAVCGFGAAVGLYVIIRKLCNRYMAAFCVVIYSSIYILQYYIKEASEYMLLFMVITWLIYVFLLLCERLSVKRVLLFTLLCVIAVFTHYGAVFAVVPLGIAVLVTAYLRGDFKCFKLGLCSFGVSGAAGGAVLLYFYLIPQSTNQVSTLSWGSNIIIEGGNIFSDFCYSLAYTFKWCTLDIDRDIERLGALWNVLLLALIAISVYVAFRTKSFFVKAFFWCNAGVFMLYYIVTKLNIYAYGWYGNRYSMFLYPLWFVMTAVSLFEFVRLLKDSGFALLSRLSGVLGVCLALGGLLYCMYGDYRVSNHWWKMDLRTVVSEWYALDGYDTPTILDFHQRYSFVYYFTHDARYDEAQWENIIYNDEVETYSNNHIETWEEYLYEIYDGELPDEVFLVTNDWNTFCEAFEDLGYTAEAVVDTTAKMYRMVK